MDEGETDKEKSVTVYITVAVWTRDPLVPVIVTVYCPASRKLQDTLAVAVVPRVTLVGVRVQLQTAVDGNTEAESATEPAKPPRLEIDKVVDLASPATVVRLPGFALRLKSCIVYMMVALCIRAPLVPLTVTV